MSDLRTLIEAETRKHEWWLAGNIGVPGMKDATTYKCLCGWIGDEPRWHQADAIVAALGVTQEWALSEGKGRRVHAISADRDEVRAQENEGDHALCELVERDVLPWQPDRWRARSHTS